MSERIHVHKHAAVKRARRQPRRNTPPVITRVHADVMRTALALAGNDASRVKIRSTGEVIVLNRSRRAA